MQIMQLLNVTAMALPVMALPSMPRQAMHLALDAANQAADQATKLMSRALNLDAKVAPNEPPCCTDICKTLPHLKVPCSYYEDTCMKVQKPERIVHAIFEAFGNDYMKVLPVCPNSKIPPSFPCKIDDTASPSFPAIIEREVAKTADVAGKIAGAGMAAMYNALPCCSKDVEHAVCKPCKGGPELFLFFDEFTGAFSNRPAIVDDVLNKATALSSMSSTPSQRCYYQADRCQYTDNLISPDDVVPIPTNLPLVG